MGNNIIKVFLSNFCIAIVGIITSFIFPKIMSIEAYSEYQEFNLYLSYIGICQMGLATGMVLNYAGRPRKAIAKNRFKSEIYLQMLIFIMFAVAFGGIYFITGKKSLIYMCICLIPYCFVESYKSLYQAWSEFSKYSLINTVIPVARVLTVLSIFALVKKIDGKIVIFTTILWYYIIFAVLMCECTKETKTIKHCKIFSKENWITLWLGLRILLGNYLDTFFKTIDKLFVNMFFGSYDFAMYSFALAMHNIMNILVTSIAQPMFPYMASHDLKDEQLKFYKELLLVFGAVAGCAYFGCSFIIKQFIPKYIGSINVMLLYFIAFPALAVINCIFINLYKINKEIKSYIGSLIILSVLSVVLNAVAIILFKNIVFIAGATTIVHYVWLIYGFFHFKTLKISLSDIFFLTLYIVIYLLCSTFKNDIAGAFVYIALIVLVSMGCYRKTLSIFIKKYVG